MKFAELVFLNSIALVFTFFSKAESIQFEKRQIRMGQVKIVVEIADNDERRSRGLMFRESLPKDQGMLFLFEAEQLLSFWMKNTRIPLSIGFFDRNRVLLEVVEMEPMRSVIQKEIPQYRSRQPAQYALEMNKGWFASNHILPGVRWEWQEAEKRKVRTSTKVGYLFPFD